MPSAFMTCDRGSVPLYLVDADIQPAVPSEQVCSKSRLDLVQSDGSQDS